MRALVETLRRPVPTPLRAEAYRSQHFKLSARAFFSAYCAYEVDRKERVLRA